MHSYEKRWNVLTTKNLSYYTDDTEEVLEMIHEGNVRFVAEGWADYRYHESRDAEGYERTEIIRRTDKSYNPDEFLQEFATTRA